MNLKGETMQRPETHKRVTQMVALLLVALAGTAVGVTAQSEDVEPAGFTGWLHGVAADDDCGRHVTVDIVDGVSQTRGYCLEQWMGTSDPRITGTYTRFVSIDQYQIEDVVPAEVPLWVSTAVHRVENDGGAWHSDVTVTATIDDVRQGGEVAMAPLVIVFSGSGDYEGLTAVVWMPSQVVNPQVRGVIFPGSPPPAPSSIE